MLYKILNLFNTIKYKILYGSIKIDNRDRAIKMMLYFMGICVNEQRLPYTEDEKDIEKDLQKEVDDMVNELGEEAAAAEKRVYIRQAIACRTLEALSYLVEDDVYQEFVELLKIAYPNVYYEEFIE